MYISEWNYNNFPTSNIRATTKVAVHCLLASSPTLKDIGTAIVHNLACKEVKSVVCIASSFSIFLSDHTHTPTTTLSRALSSLHENSERENRSEHYRNRFLFPSNCVTGVRRCCRRANDGIAAVLQRQADRGAFVPHTEGAQQIRDGKMSLKLELINHIAKCFRFANKQVSADIPQLVQMIGPHPKTFKGSSERCDELIDAISKKVR